VTLCPASRTTRFVEFRKDPGMQGQARCLDCDEVVAVQPSPAQRERLVLIPHGIVEIATITPREGSGL
jgi:hypothetical protein